MVVFPPCKINLGLHVIARRPDGFHNLDTCFYPLPWTDVLEVARASATQFRTTGITIPGSADDNLCLRAYALLKIEFDLPPVSIHLHKILPTGAGLGGGSSDAAHTLRALNTVFKLNLTQAQLSGYASSLGSDCAFFVQDAPMIGSGRGEVLESVNVSLRGKFLIVVKPDVHISTAEAYAGIVPAIPAHSVKSVVESNPVSAWRELLQNDFEESIFKKHPSIAAIKQRLYEAGAEYSSMSGSGAAVYAIFDHPLDLKNQFPDDVYWQGEIK